MISALTIHLSIQIVNDLQDWSKPISNFQDMYNRSVSDASLVASMSSMSVAPNTELILPPSSSPDATLFYNQLIGLTRFSNHVNAIDINNVFANLQMVGFTFTCLSRNTWGEIEDLTGLEAVMVQYVHLPHVIPFR